MTCGARCQAPKPIARRTTPSQAFRDQGDVNPAPEQFFKNGVDGATPAIVATMAGVALGPMASQVTNHSVESGDRRIDESGDRRAAIGHPQA